MDEILGIVVESADHNAVVGQNEIITNNVIKNNINKIHKQVFVKMKIGEDENQAKAMPRKSITQSTQPSKKNQAKSFKQLKLQRNTKGHASKKPEPESKSGPLGKRDVDISGDGVSGFSNAMENTSSSDFILQAPKESHPNYLKSRIYFFDTPKHLDIEVS